MFYSETDSQNRLTYYCEYCDEEFYSVNETLALQRPDTYHKRCENAYERHKKTCEAWSNE